MSGERPSLAKLKCVNCSGVYAEYPPIYKCLNCGSLLEYTYDFEKLQNLRFRGKFSFWRYKPLMPKVKKRISFGEGGTPLHKAGRLAEKIGVRNLFLKDETRNPTHSFRDRSAALLISNAIDINKEVLVCATQGNMGASLAAYSAKTGITCHVIVPKMVDMGKLAQMLIYDAIIEEYGEIVDEAIFRAEALVKETGWYQATPELNPLVVEAQKTIAYETVEQRGVPDWFIISMGSGETIYSVWKGFRELQKIGMIDKLPRMVGVQSAGCAPIISAYVKSKTKQKRVKKPFTHALAILVRNPLYGEFALRAISESNGKAVMVSDKEIFTAEQEIARLEGIFAEPSSSATIAALRKLVNKGEIREGDTVICLITGSGLKATDVLQTLTKKRKTAMLGLELSTKEKILRIINHKETYGYALWKKLGRTMTRGAVYQHLNELHRKGLITSHKKNGKKFFRLTRRGKKVLRAIDELKVLLAK